MLACAIAATPAQAQLAQPGSPSPSDPRLAELLERMANRPPPPGAPATGRSGARNHDTGARWLDGGMTSQYWSNCFSSTSGWTSTYTGYWGTTSGSYPRIGDRFYGHIVVGIIGNPCGGGDVPITEIAFPDGLNFNFGSDANGKPRCWYQASDGSVSEVTNQSWADCKYHGPGTWGDYNLGGRGLASYSIFEMIFPIRSTRKLIGSANTYHRIIAPVSSALGSPGLAYPYQWTWVFPPDATKTSLTVGKTRKQLKASGAVTPRQPGGRPVTVTLQRRVRGPFRLVSRRTVRLSANSTYATAFNRPRGGTCRITARFGGDTEWAASQATKSVKC